MEARIGVIALVSCVAVGVVSCSKPAQAPQQGTGAVGTAGKTTEGPGTIYGTPGSPTATVAINGDQLPPPPQAFGKLEKLTLTIDRPKLTPADIERLKAAAATAADSN
jgi:hypothetical protein